MGDVKMAWAVNGIDLVVGGRSQNPACMKAKNVLDRAYLPGTDCRLDRQNGTWVVQAHEWGKCVEWADFEYCNGDCKRVPYALIPINLNECGGPNAGRLRAFTQFAGLQLVITDGVVSRVRVRGETLEAGRSDRLVRIKFQATCGDGYRNLIPHTSFVDTGFIDADVLRTFIADQGG